MFVDPRVEHILCDWEKSAFGYTPPKWKKNGYSCYKSCTFVYDFDGETLTVYSDRPSFLIGVGGKIVNEYAVKVKEVQIPYR